LQVEARHCCLTSQLRKAFTVYHTDSHKEIEGIGGVKDRLGKLQLGQKWKDKPCEVGSFLSFMLFGAFVNALNNR